MMNFTKIALSCLLFTFYSNAFAQSFSDAPNAAIVDNACGSDSVMAVFNVTGIGTLGNGVGELLLSTVQVDITHTWAGDVHITLVSPAQTIIELSTGNGGSTENYIGTIFSDEASNPITGGSGPFTGLYIPEESLSTFNGENADGTWTLKVCDSASGDVGTLDSASITFAPPPVCTNPGVSDTARIVDCASPFTIDVVIDNTGSGTSYTISDDQLTTPITGVSPGSLTNFGSYSIGTNVTITVTDETEMSCAVVLSDIVVTECPPDCPVSLDTPTDGAVDQDLAALFTWTAPTTGGAPAGYKIVIGTTNPPQDTLTGVFPDTLVTIFGLAIETTYFWFIYSTNDEGDSPGCASLVSSFTTKGLPDGPSGVTCSEPVSPSFAYEESFEAGSFPAGWTGDLGSGATNQNWNVLSGTTGSTGTGPSAASDGTFYMYYEATGTGTSDSVYVTSSAISLANATEAVELSFDLHAFGPNVGTIEVGASTSATGPWTNIFSWVGPIQSASADTFHSVGLDLTSFIGGNVFLHFTAEYGGGFAGDIAIDKIKIESCLSCSPISNVSTDTLSSDYVGISYTDGLGCTGVTIELGEAPYTLGTNAGTSIACAVEMASMSGLLAETSYEYYLMNLCAGGVADTLGPFSFTTLCEAFILPTIEPFDAFVPNQCWDEAGDGTPATGPSDLGTGLWGADGFGNVGFTGAARINLYTTDRTDWILTPSYDLSSGGPFEMKYDIALTGFAGTLDTVFGSDDFVQVLISTDNGATWQMLKTYDNTTPVSAAGLSETVDLSAYSGTVQFGIYATDGSFDDPNDIDFFFDNFEILNPNAAPGCTMLVTPSDGEIDVDEDIDLVWTPAAGAPTSYEVNIGTMPGMTDVLNGFNVGDTLMYDPGTLLFNQTYYVTIVAVNAGGSATGCTETSFTIRDTPCGISDLEVGNVYGTDAEVNWMDEAGCVSVVVEYGLASFTIGSGTQIPVACGAGTVQIPGLTPETTYDVYVISVCSGESDTTSTSLTTTCGVQSVPTLEPFDTFLPTSCWEEASTGTPATGPMSLGFGSWAADGFGNNGFSGSARINLSSNFTSDWVISPLYDISTGGPYNLLYDVAMTGNSGTTDTILGTDDQVQILITVDSGTTWTALEIFDSSSSITAAGSSLVEDLSAYSNVVQFAFYGTDGATDDPNNINFYIDNFEIASPLAVPNCTSVNSPADLAVDVNEESDISWPAAGGAPTAYLVVMGTTPGGFDIADSVNVGNVLTYDPGTLTYGQTYYSTIIPLNLNGTATGCDTTSFTVRDIPCGVINEEVTNILGESATVNWMDEAGCTGLDVEFGPSPYTAGTGTSLTIGCGVGTAGLTGLLAETDYTVLIISTCLAGNDTTTLSFTTICASIIPTYIEPFDTFLPGCWEEAGDGDPSTGPSDLGTGFWTGDGFANNGSTGAAKINLYTTNRTDWLISPYFDLSTGGPFTLNYDVALTIFGSTSGTDTMMGSDDRVELLITIDSGMTWQNLELFNSSSSIPAAGETLMEDLTAYNGIVRFAFYGTDGVVDDAPDVDFFVDNFQILSQSAIPFCTSLTEPADGATDVDEDADLTWTAALGNPLGYRIVMGRTPGGTEYLDNVPVLDTTTYDPGTLNFDSTYYVVIKPFNDNGLATGCDTTSFTVRSIPCGIADAAVNDIAIDTANVVWSDEAGCNGVQVEFGPTPYTPGTGSTMNQACNSGGLTLSGLSVDTEYDVLIISNCASGSDTTTLTFTTNCAAFETVPYCHNFDGSNNCWSVINANGDDDTWIIGSSDPFSGSNHATYTWNGVNDADDWLFSPQIALTSGTEYTVSFGFQVESSSFPESIEVFAGTGDSIAAMTNLLFQLIDFNNTTYVFATMSFTPGTSENYNIGLHAISAADQFNLYVDDFCIKECATGMVTSDSLAGPGSMMDVLTNVCADGIVMFDAGVATDTLPMTAFLVDHEITVMGNGAAVNFISGQGTDRLFWITPNGILNILDASLIDAAKSPDGGAILNYGMLNLNNVTMEGNTEGATPKSVTLKPGSTTTIDGQVTSKQ